VDFFLTDTNITSKAIIHAPVELKELTVSAEILTAFKNQLLILELIILKDYFCL